MNKEAEFLVKVAYLRGQADAQNELYRRGYIKEAANWWPALVEKLKTLATAHPYAVGAGLGAGGGALGGYLEGLIGEAVEDKYDVHPAYTNAALGAVTGIAGGPQNIAAGALGGGLRGLASNYIADKADMSLPAASSVFNTGVGAVGGAVGLGALLKHLSSLK